MGLSERSKRATLADVAREAGVSIQTASHVLSGTETARVAEATRVRAKEAAAKVRYQPNMVAQAMRYGKTNVVSIWMPLDRPILTYLRYLHMFQELSEQEGYQIMVMGLNTKSALTNEGEIPRMWPVDGIISVDAGKAIGLLREDPQYDSIPAVVLGYESYKNTDSVAWDLLGAAREAVRRMIRAGRKEIAFVAPQRILDDFPNERRRRGYNEAMEEAGLKPRYIGIAQDTSEVAELGVLADFEKNGVPQGVLAFTDAVSIGVARAALHLKRRIPDDCQIWGLGDYPESADFRIPLSTIRPPREKIVNQAWKWLGERMDNIALEPRFVEYEMELIERESTRT